MDESLTVTQNNVAHTLLTDPVADTAIGTETTPAPIAETPASGAVCRHCGDVHPGGRFVKGCPGPRLADGHRSALVRSGAVTGQEDIIAARRVELRAELGDLGVVKGSLADTFVELDAVRAYLAGRLATEGPLTGKGRTRALLTAYLAVVSQQTRLAAVLGLDRITTHIDPHAAIEAALDRANQQRRE